MLNNKKAQIFTLIAIAIIMLFFVSYEIYSTIQERLVIKTRVKTMDSFLFSLEQDLVRKLYISGFRAVFLAENEITKSGRYISNFSSFFSEAVFQGTINGISSDIMEGATISDITTSMQDKAAKMNLLVSLSDISVSVGQEDPWNIVVYLNATLNLTDKGNLARWYKNETIKSFVSIEGFEDPLYLINTAGKVTRKIYRTPYEGNYVSGGDITNLSLHIEGRHYTSHNDAPGFIKRLEGNNSADNAGIESFVYIPELSAQGLQVQEKSCVDYIYFSSSNPTSSQVSGLPAWFWIDNAHKTKYQIGGS